MADYQEVNFIPSLSLVVQTAMFEGQRPADQPGLHKEPLSGEGWKGISIP